MSKIGETMDSDFKFSKTGLSGVMELSVFCREDVRGDFLKSYNEDIFSSNGIDFRTKEIFFANSRKGVVRGLHIVVGKPQAKLIQCLKGRIWDVVVDLDRDSPTFGKWQAIELSEENRKAVLVPNKCAHGYYVLEDATVCYICDECFYPKGDAGIRWDDEDIGIEWPLDGTPLLSEKDKALPSLKEFLKADKMD